MKRDTRRLIAVASGFETKSSRSSQSLKLLSWGFRNSDTFKISKKNESQFKIKTWLGKANEINGITKEDVFLTLNKKDSRKLKVIIEYEGPISAPIDKDVEIAKLNIFKNNELLKSVPIYSNEKVEKVNFFKSLFLSINYLIWGDA